jgi:hypothetical protein
LFHHAWAMAGRVNSSRARILAVFISVNTSVDDSIG